MSGWMEEGKLMFTYKDYLTYPVHCTVRSSSAHSGNGAARTPYANTETEPFLFLLHLLLHYAMSTST